MSISTKILKGAFVNTGEANCSIFESGRMVYTCLNSSEIYSLDYFSLDKMDLPAFARDGSLIAPDADGVPREYAASDYDFWVFNWHFITMAQHVAPESVARLPGLKFTIVLELAPGDPLKLVPKGVFDGYIALDPNAQPTAEIFPFPRPLEGEPKTPRPRRGNVPVIGSFGFGTPGKGFELLVEAVSREFDQAVVRVNIPYGDYVGFPAYHREKYHIYITNICKKIAKPGILIDFTYDFMSPEELIEWCGDNDLNCFMYTRCQPGLSATTDQAIVSGRPLVTLSNDTFRHIHRYIPPFPTISLKEALSSTQSMVANIQRDWSRSAFLESFHDMLAAFELLPGRTPRTTQLSGRAQQTIVVASPGGTERGLLGYAVRFADSIDRSGDYRVVRLFGEEAKDLASYLASDIPDAVVLIDVSAEDLEAAKPGLSDVSGPKLLVGGKFPLSPDMKAVGIIERVRRPIVPFFTVSSALAEDAPVWLVGFDAPGSNLEEVVDRISREMANAVILVEDSSGAGNLDARIAQLRQRNIASGLYLERRALPWSGDEIITRLAEATLIVVHHDPRRTDILEDFCSLAMITERCVAFTRAAPLPVFADKAAFIEDHVLADLYNSGVASRMGLFYDFGEWMTRAEIDRLMEGAEPTADLGTIDKPATDSIATTGSRATPLLGVTRSAATGTGGPTSGVTVRKLLSLEGTAFLDAAYHAVLGRYPDPKGMRHYLNALGAGMRRGQIIADLRRSGEGVAYGADFPGLGGLVRRERLLPFLTLGYSSRKRARNSAAQRDGVTTRKLLGLSDEAFVSEVYRAVLGRFPDPEGTRHYRAALRAGRRRSQVIADLRRSAEGVEYGASFPGLDALLRRELVLGILPINLVRSLRRSRSTLGAEPREISSNSESRENVSLVATDTDAVAVGQSDDARVVAPAIPNIPLPHAAPATVFILAGIVGRDDLALADHTRHLVAAWVQLGRNVQMVLWNVATKRFQLPSPAEAEQCGWRALVGRSRWSPIRSAEIPFVLEKGSCGADDWILSPGPFRFPGDPAILMEVNAIVEARRLGLHTAFIFDGATPLRDPACAGDPARTHEQYMQALLLADLVTSTSARAARDLNDFLTEHQLADFGPYCAQVSIPPGIERETQARWQEYARKIDYSFSKAIDSTLHFRGVYLLSDGDSPGDEARRSLAYGLESALADLGFPVIPSEFDSLSGGLRPRSGGDEASSGGAAPASWKAPEDADAPRWILLPAGVGTESVDALLAFARSNNLRIAAILHWDAEIAEFDQLWKLDKVLAVSDQTREAFSRYLLSSRANLHCAAHRYVAVDSPQEIVGLARRVRPVASSQGRARGLVDLRRLEPGVGQGLLAAAATAASRHAMALDVIVDPMQRAALAATEARPVPSESVRYIEQPTTDDLIALLDRCDVCICPHEEHSAAATIIPLALWRGVPCLAQGGGGLPELGVAVTDFAQERQLVEQITRFLDPEQQDRLYREVATRDFRGYSAYAHDVATVLATDRLDETVHPLKKSTGRSVYTELVNLRARPKLSLCISTYNRAGWLAVSLRNIFTQCPVERDNLEILIVDNTSTDSTPEVVQPYLDRADFTYIRNPENVGMLGNLAVTVQRARGEYIWIIGDDDLTRAGSIDQVLSALKRSPAPELVYVNYGYTSENDPAAVGDIDHFLDNFNILEPEGPDEGGLVKDLAAKCENFYTAIYAFAARRDHAMRAYCQDTSGRIFSTMVGCIPSTYYILNYMPERAAYWIGRPSLVVNSNVSWAAYGPMLDLEHLPEAWDLAQRTGTPVQEVDRRRANRLWLVEMMWRDLFENDPVGNAAFCSPERIVMRLKHLPEFETHVPELQAIYRRAHDAGNPAAQLDPEILFSAFS